MAPQQACTQEAAETPLEGGECGKFSILMFIPHCQMAFFRMSELSNMNLLGKVILSEVYRGATSWVGQQLAM